jgi:hypothetical protein
LVPLPPSDETKSCEVDAVPVTVKIDEVALVEKRLVDDAVVLKKLVEVPLPEAKKLPLIDSLSLGVVEPIPNLPLASIVSADIVEVANVDGDAVAM